MKEPVSIPRKPAREEGRVQKCFCGHTQSAHGPECGQCDCRGWQARPCVCGHPYSRHLARCQEPNCECRRYREDASPEFLLRMGVRAGQWQFVTLPQLKALMDPGRAELLDIPPAMRIWACGMLHSIGQRGRLAVKTSPNGKQVPLTPKDIANELNALEPIGRMEKGNLRKGLLQLERAGMARRVGRLRNNVRLFFYAKPLRSRKVSEDLNLVVPPDYQILLSDSKISQIRDAQISHIRRTLVKSFLRTLRKEIGPDADLGNLGVSPDYQNQIEKELEPVVLGVRDAYQRVALVVRRGRAYKEDSISSSKQAGTTESPEVPDACMPAPPPQPQTTQQPKLAAIRDLFPNDYLSDQALGLLDQRIAAELGPDYDRESAVAFVRRRAMKGNIRPGLLFHAGGLAAEYCKKARQEADRWQAAAAVNAAYMERQKAEAIRIYRGILDDPAASDQEKQFARECLELEDSL